MPPEATEPLPVPDTGVHHEVSPARTAPSWGKPLTEGDYAALATSWITREIADAAMLRRVDQHEGREIVGQKGKRDCAGIIFPYYWPLWKRGQDRSTWRDRRDVDIEWDLQSART